MGVLNAGSGGCCLRWSAMASTAVHRQVGDERHGCCALVSARGLGDVGEILIGSRQKASRLFGRKSRRGK